MGKQDEIDMPKRNMPNANYIPPVCVGDRVVLVCVILLYYYMPMHVLRMSRGYCPYIAFWYLGKYPTDLTKPCGIFLECAVSINTHQL